MKIPRILVIDDQYAVEADLRADLCDRCNLVEVMESTSDLELEVQGSGKLAGVVFCAGQKRSGDQVANSLDEVDRTISAGWPGSTGWRWAMIFLDIRFDSKPNRSEDKSFGLRILEHLVEKWPDTMAAPGNCDLPVVMLSTIPFQERGGQANRAGAHGYTDKADLDEAAVRELLEEHGLIPDSAPRGRPEHRLLIGGSLALLKVLREGRRIGRQKFCNALILGPQGSGKTTLGEYMHAYSGRTGAFVPYYVKPSTANLQYGELFGSWRGAHSEAHESNCGHAEQAHQGTLVIEEVHGLKTDSQVELLQFGRLEGSRRLLRRLGKFPTSPDAAVRQARQSIRGEYDPSRELITVNVLLLATSNYPLDEPVWRAANGFQEPLYTRLATEYAGGPIHVPSLLERREDVPLLFEVMLKRATEKLGGVWPKHVAREVMDRLREIDWTGDIAGLWGIARKVAEAAKSWQEVLLRHLPVAKHFEPSEIPTVVPLPNSAQSTDIKTVTFADALGRLKAVNVTGTRRELHGSLRDLDAAYGQLAQKLLEMALDATPETGDTRKDPALGDLSPTKAIKLLLKVDKLSTTQAADEILRICKSAELIPDNSDLGRVLAWAKKRRRGAKAEKQEPDSSPPTE